MFELVIFIYLVVLLIKSAKPNLSTKYPQGRTTFTSKPSIDDGMGLLLLGSCLSDMEKMKDDS